MESRRALKTTMVVVVIVIATIVFVALTSSHSPVKAKDTISLSGFSIRTGNNGDTPVEPIPYLSGDIYVNASTGVTWSSYTLYTNNVDCGTQMVKTSTTLNYFAYFFQGAPCVSVTAGDTYLMTFVVEFTDGTNDTASVSVTAQ
jgi:hypothetical protein